VKQNIVVGCRAVSLGEIVIGGSGSLVDTYDANSGYVGGAGGANVTLVANGLITLNPATVVSGNLVTGSTWNGSGSVSGTYTPNVTPLPVTTTAYPYATCPTTGYTPRTDLPVNLNSSTYDQALGKFIVKSQPVTLDDTPSNGGYYFDLLSVSDQLNISYSATPNPVTIYIHDKLVESSGSQINNLTQKPGLLTIKACLQPGDPTTYIGHGISMTGGADAYMQIYAPGRDVVVGGGGALFGAVVGGGNTKKVSFTGGSQMHYDLQLVGVGNLRTVITGAWAETQPF